MLFTNKINYGISEEIFLRSMYKAYINFASVKTNLGDTPGNATSISSNKIIALKKCYSEFLERYSLGISINSEKIIQSFEYINRDCINEKEKHFSYGNTSLGHSDTTGTAAGLYSEDIIKKGLCEIIEKNDLLCFWYGNCGYEIKYNILNTDFINKYGFIADYIRLFVVKEVSNFPTVVAVGFKNEKLITTGICCAQNIFDAIRGAVHEAKIIEWQQYNNSESIFNRISTRNSKDIINRLSRKCLSVYQAQEYDSESKSIIFSEWVKSVRIKEIFFDTKYGLKVIKIVSNELINSVPTMSNVKTCLNKEIVKRYYKNQYLDCPIV